MTIRDLMIQANLSPEKFSEGFLSKEVLCENFCPMRFNRYVISGNFLSDIEEVYFSLQDDSCFEEITLTLLYCNNDRFLYTLVYCIPSDGDYEDQDY